MLTTYYKPVSVCERGAVGLVGSENAVKHGGGADVVSEAHLEG